jgi:DNA-binding response OmpR family regulator
MLLRPRVPRAEADERAEEPTMSVREVRDQELTRPDEEDVRVLFVEDDPTVAEMYRMKLELDGYSVVVATDGEQALRIAREDPPDIIFLDVRLPKIDGLGVLEALRGDDRTRAVPVVILSNYSQQELVERGLELGALEYLVKSQMTPARVADGVAAWLRS